MTTRIGLDTNLMIAMYGDPDSWSGVSASGAGAAIGCPTRLALPAAYTSSEAADRGTALHEFARKLAVNPEARAQALLDVPDKWRPTAEGMDLADVLTGLRCVGFERAYALNVKDQTVRYIGENIDRRYNEVLVARGEAPLGRYEIPFTMDVEAFLDDTPVELDYKSGQNIGEPSEHWQRRICSIGLMLYHDTPTAISRVIYIWNDGQLVPDGHEFSIIDVDDYCDELVRMIDRVWQARLLFANGIMPALSPSEDTCAFCPAVASCPYYTNFAKSMLGRLEEIQKGPELSTLTDEEKGRIWEDAKRAEKMIETILDGLKLMADQKPIPVGDKYEVRPHDRTKAYFDQTKARGLIVTLLGKTGTPDTEIEKTLKGLNGRTEYQEFRKVKRQLPIAS